MVGGVSGAKPKKAPELVSSESTPTSEAAAPLQPADPGAVQKAQKTVSAPPTSPGKLDLLNVSGSFPLSAIHKVETPTRTGQVFRLDGGFLDALKMQVRRVRFESGESGYQLEFKIAGPSRESFAERMVKKGAAPKPFEFFPADVLEEDGTAIHAHTGELHSLASSFHTHADHDNLGDSQDQALHLEGTNWRADYSGPGSPIALRGGVRILLEGDDQACNNALKDAVQKLGLQDAFAPPTKTSIRRYMLMKLLWHVRPQAAKELSSAGPMSSLKISTVEKTLKKAGVTAKRMGALRYEEVAPGHFTVIDPTIADETKHLGLRYAYSTVSEPEHVHSILLNGQKSTLTRWSEGTMVAGMSSMTDVGSGGAQGVFSRLVMKKSEGAHWNGRTYRVVLKPELLNRLDIWGWSSDEYGQSWDLTEENHGAGLVKLLSGSSYTDDNEIISPVGNSPEYIACVTAPTEQARSELISHLSEQGYEPPNGKSLHEFVKLEPTIRADLLDD